MNDPEYPMPIDEVIATLIEFCTYEPRLDLVEILKNAHPQCVLIDYDNWNGGTYTYCLKLELPTAVFAAHHAKIPKLEQDFLDRISTFDRAFENENLSQVTIIPTSTSYTTKRKSNQHLSPEIEHLWTNGYFRLFLSHLADHKVAVHALKQDLRPFGIAAFVAHDDIQPSKQWQSEIELALCSMDALAALVTPRFTESHWCDQEVGWAFGRGISVIPVRLGSDPTGFAGKYQAISGSLEYPQFLARSIFDALRSKPETQQIIYRSLPLALLHATSFRESIDLAKWISEFVHYTPQDKKLIWQACETNDQVFNAHKVKSSLYAHIGSPPGPQEEDETPF